MSNSEIKNNSESQSSLEEALGALNTMLSKMESVLGKSEDPLSRDALLRLEVGKMYSYYALDYCVKRLDNQSVEEPKNDILKTRKILQQLKDSK